MSLLFCDSFDHYVTADMFKKWTTPGIGGSAVAPTVVPAEGRCGSQALHFVGLSGATKGVTVTGSAEYGWCGYALHAVSTFGGSDLFVVQSSGDQQFTLKWTIAGALIVTPFLRAVILTTAADVIRTGGWYFLEISWRLHATLGAVTVRVNNVVVGTVTGVNTTAAIGSSTSWNAVTLACQANTELYVDDFYLLDDTDDGLTPATNTFLGDVRIEYLRPTSDGANTDWTVTGGGTQANAVDKDANSALTTPLIETAVVGDRSTNGYANPTVASGPCFGVQISALAVKDVAGAATVQAVVRHAGSEAVGPSLAPSQTTSSYLVTTLQRNPVTAAAWTLANVAADEFGVVRDT